MNEEELREIESKCRELTWEWEQSDEPGYWSGEMAPRYMQDIPKLIAEVRRLQDVIKEWENLSPVWRDE